MRAFAVVAASLFLLPPSAARAESPQFSHREYTNYCTTGAFSACASVSVRVWTTSSASLIVIRFRNMQGSAYGFDNTGGSSLGFFQMDHRNDVSYGVPFPNPPGLDWPGSEIVTQGLVGELGKIPGGWDASLDIGHASQWNPFGTGKGVFGCDALPIDPDAPDYDFGPSGGYSGAYQTCPSRGLDGWVEMSVLIDIPSTAADWELFWTMTSYPNDPASATCDTSDPASCTSLTPEPVTMTLIATGLAGMSLAGLRRRRR